jgi:hypothetical protein
MRDLVDGVEDRRDVPGDRLAVVDRDGFAAGPLEDDPEELEPPRAGRFDGEQTAALLFRDGPDFTGRFVTQWLFHRTKKRAEPASRETRVLYQKGADSRQRRAGRQSLPAPTLTA